MRNKLITAALITAAAVAARAQDDPATTGATNAAPSGNAPALSLEAPVNEHGVFGIGALIGEPVGVGAKLWFSEKTAVDAGAGRSFEGQDGFQVHGDFLYHVLDLFHVGRGELPLYFGVGGRVKFIEHADNRAGIRFPVGVSYLFPDAPVEVFTEVAPILDLAPDTSLQWNGGIGIRYYFR